MIRKVAALVALAFVVYYVATAPQEAANEVRQLAALFAATMNAIASFGQAVSG